MPAVVQAIAEAASSKARCLFRRRDNELRLRAELDTCVARNAQDLGELIEMIHFLYAQAPDEDWHALFGVVCVDGQNVLSPDIPERLL